MPTASIKAEKVKQPTLEANEPLRQGITIVEHKIRNLEKRKTKLDSYKAVQASGKELNQDQLQAIEKYDEVIHTLEFSKDLCKQLNVLAAESAKTLKKQLRKETAEKQQQEVARTRDMLIIQDVLSNLGTDQVREDLIEGKAKVTITADDLAQIDQLYIELSPKQEEPPVPYLNQFQSPADHMSALLEGKSKEAFGTTYAALKTKLMDIASSGYFDPAQAEVPQPPAPEVVQPVEEPPQAQPIVNEVVETPAPKIVTAPIVPNEPPTMPVMQEVSQLESQLIQMQQAAVAAANAQRHITVFESGAITFIQENEVEDMEEKNSIPTLTYTNQNYTPSKGPQPVEPPVEDSWAEESQNNVVETVPAPQGFQQVPVISQQEDDAWGDEAGDNSGWQEANHGHGQSHHHSHQNNDGFIQAGGGRGRGGRGRGRGGGANRGGQKPRPNNRGGYRDGGGYNRENREGGYNRDNREGGYNRDNREGGYNKEGGQNYYQNGYRGGGGERRGGSTHNFTEKGERGWGRGGAGGGGGRGRGGNSNYRGAYRQQQ